METFKETIWTEGRRHYRDMPWREDTRPYYVLVSELMLQQTQVARVIPKFEAFIARFPDERSLAEASLADVIGMWQGLGYNRRAKFLHEAARMIVHDFDGVFPSTYDELVNLPGVGRNTAGAILAYSYNQPSIFIETNIRTVYIHHFFADDFEVDDKQILQKLLETAPWGEGKEQHERRIHSAHGAMRKTAGLSYGPKAFYWALMDYGAWLKAQGVKNISRSKHYKKQSPLEGSVRQVRGQIIRQLLNGITTESGLRASLHADDRFLPALHGLINDGLISASGDELHLTK